MRVAYAAQSWPAVTLKASREESEPSCNVPIPTIIINYHGTVLYCNDRTKIDETFAEMNAVVLSHLAVLLSQKPVPR